MTQVLSMTKFHMFPYSDGFQSSQKSVSRVFEGKNLIFSTREIFCDINLPLKMYIF